MQGRSEPHRAGAGVPNLPFTDLTSLPDEVKGLVRAQLETGHARPVDEVVREALRFLHECEGPFPSPRNVLRSQVAEGASTEERAGFRDGARAIVDVHRCIDERLRKGE